MWLRDLAAGHFLSHHKYSTQSEDHQSLLASIKNIFCPKMDTQNDQDDWCFISYNEFKKRLGDTFRGENWLMNCPRDIRSFGSVVWISKWTFQDRATLFYSYFFEKLYIRIKLLLYLVELNFKMGTLEFKIKNGIIWRVF